MKYLRRDLPRAIVCCLVLGLGISIVAATAAAQCVSGPQMLAGWDFNGVTNYGDNDFFPISPNPDTEDRCAFATGLIRNWTSGMTGAATNAWGGTSFAQNTTGLADAIAAGNFVTFSIQAVPGTTISLSEISAHRVRRSGTGPSDGQWQYSTDGINFTNLGTTLNWPVSTPSGNAQSPIDLSGISVMQNLSGQSTITFRLAVLGGNRFFRHLVPD